MKQIDIQLDDSTLGEITQVGHLTHNQSKTGDTVRFDYSQTWLDGAEPITSFALDQELILARGAHYASAGANQLSGIFLDCSPDCWGKMLMDRREAIEAREEKRSIKALRSWDYLVGVNDESRMGALRLYDAAAEKYVDTRNRSAPPITELRTLEEAARIVESGDDENVDKWLKQLIDPGASLGGARPKASFRDTDGSLWLAKFPASDDRRDVGLWEYLTQQLSLQAGINMPPARALKLSTHGHTFAVQRFDRTRHSRRLYASAMTRLARIDSNGASYLDIVQAIENDGTSTHIKQQLVQLFRRVLFNIIMGNRDDHLRNHGFLREGNGWMLSPAFDVNPNPEKSEHVLSIDGNDASPDSALLMETAAHYRLTSDAANTVAEEVRNAVRDWDKKAKTLGLRNSEIMLMQSVINPER